MSDAELVRRCRAGDAAAWPELVERYSRFVYAIATRVYRLDGADAEDVFQDVFARVYTHLDRLRAPDALRPWIGQLTRRTAIDHLRRAAREEPVEAPREEGAEDAGYARVELALDVHAALDELSPDCREALDGFFARDLSYAAIAAELGVPVGTIASRISRCLTQLRQIMATREADAPPARPVGSG